MICIEITGHHVPGGFNPTVIREETPIGTAYVVGTPDGDPLFGLRFQEGSPAEAVNGGTVEALLAIAMDRLKEHQKGPYPSHHNEIAIANAERAMEALKDRTRERKV